MWRWNVIQLDMTCVMNGMLVGIQLHSKEAISGFHFQFHRWNVEVLVVHVSCGEESGDGGVGGVGRCLVLYKEFLYVLAHACSWTATTIEHKAGDAGDPIGAPRACRTTLSPTVK